MPEQAARSSAGRWRRAAAFRERTFADSRDKEDPMQRLSALDAGFLYLETTETPINIGIVTVFAPAADPPDVVFQKFRDHTASRLDRLPFYRPRPVMTPLGIAHPVWVAERALDLDAHIQRRALARPGTMEQLRS